MSEAKVKWSGGRYGECPFVQLGNMKYYIGDRKGLSGRYEYALLAKDVTEGFDFEFRSNLADWEYGQLRKAAAIFERWFRVRFKCNPPLVEESSRSRRYEYGRFIFWVDKPFGKPPCLICRTTGRLVDGYYESMGACKRAAGLILAREIERRQAEESL